MLVRAPAGGEFAHLGRKLRPPVMGYAPPPARPGPVDDRATSGSAAVFSRQPAPGHQSRLHQERRAGRQRPAARATARRPRSGDIAPPGAFVQVPDEYLTVTLSACCVIWPAALRAGRALLAPLGSPPHGGT